MTEVEQQNMHQRELHAKLWQMANDLRGNMEPYEFKNYILGMIFYRYLSDKTIVYMDKLLKDDDVIDEIKSLDISNLTPIEALNTLYQLQNKLKNRW